MPIGLRSIYFTSGGLFTDTDRITLNRGLRLRDDSLIDSATGISHRLHPLAQQALAIIQKGPVAISDWVGQLQNLGITKSQFLELIIFLDKLGGLHVQRLLIGWLKIGFCQIYGLALGTAPHSLTKRFSANAQGILFAITTAMGPVFIGVSLISFLAVSVNLNYQIVNNGFLVALFSYVSILVHELVHIILLRNRHQSLCILQRGLRLGVLYSKKQTAPHLLSALAGPVLDGITALLLGVIGAKLLKIDSLILLGQLVAGLHLLSLLPIFGDGRALLRSIIHSQQYAVKKKLLPSDPEYSVT